MTLSRTGRLLNVEKHQAVFGWVLERLVEADLLRGKMIGVDAPTPDVKAAMRSIVRRATAESYREYLRKPATANGEATDAAGLEQRDRKRRENALNKDWLKPRDPEAQIKKMKDGRTLLAYRAEQPLELETGEIVATTTHPDETNEAVHSEGVEELVAGRRYHSAAMLRQLAKSGERSYV